MKKAILFLWISLCMASCSSYHEVTTLKQLANGDIDKNANYVCLSVNTGHSKKEIKRSQARIIDTAVAQLLRDVPGGEYITNAKVYVVKGNYLAVSGDVWGRK